MRTVSFGATPLKWNSWCRSLQQKWGLKSYLLLILKQTVTQRWSNIETSWMMELCDHERRLSLEKSLPPRIRLHDCTCYWRPTRNRGRLNSSLSWCAIKQIILAKLKRRDSETLRQFEHETCMSSMQDSPTMRNIKGASNAWMSCGYDPRCYRSFIQPPSLSIYLQPERSRLLLLRTNLI